MVAFVVLRHPVTISVKDLINPDNFYIFDIHENRIRGGSELKQMLGICNLNSILLQHVTSSYEFGVNALNTQSPFLNIISVFNHIKLNFTKLLLVIFQFLANFFQTKHSCLIFKHYSNFCRKFRVERKQSCPGVLKPD